MSIVPAAALDPTRAPARCDFAVVGAGIVGLAVGRELTRRHPHASVCVLEREQELAAHQSGHSSGVIHAGIYYTPGSLKARLCVQGARELYEYCEAHDIPHERCGKLILATGPHELARLSELERRGNANGVRGLRRIVADELASIEPHARAIEGLHSPDTGIVDFAAVARSYACDVEEAGGTITTGWEIAGVEAGARALRLRSSAAALGPTASRPPPGQAPIRGSCPSAARIFACAPSAGTSCARSSTRCRTHRCPSSAPI